MKIKTFFNSASLKFNFSFLFFCFLFLFFLFQCKSKVSEKNSSSSEPVKNPPTEITLSADSIDENQPIGTVIAKLTADGGDGNSYTFSFVSGEGDDDNDSFKIEDLELKTAKSFDFETKNTYKVRIKVTDNNDKSFETALVIKIKNVNEDPNSPTDITLSANSIDENKVIGTVIGSLTSTDATTGDSFTYSLVSGAGDDDNGDFTIDGDKLKSAKIFDFETKNSYKIRIQTSDKEGNTFQKAFTITIKDIVEPPVFTYKHIVGNSFYEKKANDGGLIELFYVMKVTIKDGAFIGDANRETVLTKDTHYTTSNVPNGLTMNVRVIKSTDHNQNFAYLYFTGKATSHSAADSVNNVGITFKSAALQNAPDLSVASTKTKNNISITYDAKIAYVNDQDDIDRGEPITTFREVSAGDFPPGGTYLILLAQDTFVNTIANNSDLTLNTHYQVVGTIPTGLAVKINKLNNNTTIISLTGTAANHANSDDFEFSIKLLDAAVTSGDVSTIIGATDGSLKFRADFRD